MLPMNPLKRSCPERQEHHSALQHAMYRIKTLESEVVEQSQMIHCLTASLTESGARHREELRSREEVAKKMVQDAVGRISMTMTARDEVRDSERDQQVREMIKFQMEKNMKVVNTFVDKKQGECQDKLRQTLVFYENVKALHERLNVNADASQTDCLAPSNNSSSTNATTTKSASTNTEINTATNTPANTTINASLAKMQSKVAAQQKALAAHKKALEFNYGLVKKKQLRIDSLEKDIKGHESVTDDKINGMEAKLVNFACDLQKLLDTNRKLRTLITDNEKWEVGYRPLCTTCDELSTRVYKPYLGEFARDSARWFKLLPMEERLDTMFDLERAKRAVGGDDLDL